MTQVPLHTLSPNTWFQVGEDDDYGRARQGRLLYANEYRARVLFKQRGSEVEYPVEISPNTLVTMIPAP